MDFIEGFTERYEWEKLKNCNLEISLGLRFFDLIFTLYKSSKFTKFYYFLLDKLVLIRYLKVCDYDIEKAKDLLELNMNIRSKNASMFSDRDIRSKALQKTANTVYVKNFFYF